MPLHLLLVAVLAAGAPAGLAAPQKKEFAMQLVSSAENSSLDWRAQYRYIQDIHDGRGYTAGIIGFCSGTGDMLEVVRAFTRAKPHNGLRRFIPALRRVNGSASHEGLGKRFVAAWRRALGQFAYYDAVVHGFEGMRGVRERALARAATPAAGGDETAYLDAFLNERVVEMHKEAAHDDGASCARATST